MFSKRLFGLVFVMILTAVFVGESSAETATIHVNEGAVLASDDGQCSLIEAIENANDTTTGQPHPDCAAGDPSGTDTLTLASFATYSWDTVYSDYNGLPPITSDIVIEGNNATLQRGDNAQRFRFFFLSGGSLDIRDMTLVNGATDLDSDPIDGEFPDIGGAIGITMGDLSVSDVVFVDNVAQFGGAIGLLSETFSIDQTITIRDAVFTGNSAKFSGGAVSAILYDAINSELTLTIDGSDFVNNEAQTSGGGALHGVALGASVTLGVTVSESEFLSNEVPESRGGAVSLFGANGGDVAADFSNTLFDDNRSQGGGAIYNQTGSTLTLTTTTLRNNRTAGDGTLKNGGAIYNGGVLHMARSLLQGNISAEDGGAIYNSGTATVEHSTISGNRATQFGGGLHNVGDPQSPAALALTFSTVVDNSAEAGGGISVHRNGVGTSTASEIEVANSILFANSAATFGSDDCVGNGTITSRGNNLVADDRSSGCPLNSVSDRQSADPASDIDLTLRDNGGDTLTHALLPNSLAIDGVTVANGISCDGASTLDQRGTLRGTGNAGAACDIGAYEYQSATPTAVALQTMTADHPTSFVSLLLLLLLTFATVALPKKTR